MKGEVYALTLTLFMFFCAADHANHAFSADDLALFTDFLN